MAREISWLRIALEGATIVGSILLAFGIEAAWSAHQERNEEVRLLRAVLQDSRANLAEIETRRAYHEAALGRERQILALVDADASGLEVQAADSLIADLAWWYGSVGWHSGGLDALTQGGRLELVGNEELRIVLASWSRNLETIRKVEDQENEFFNALFMPYLHEHAWVPQIAEIAKVLPGTSDDFGYGVVNFRRELVDHRPLLVSTGFQNLVLNKLWIQTDILRSLEALRTALLELVNLLEAELR